MIAGDKIIGSPEFAGLSNVWVSKTDTRIVGKIWQEQHERWKRKWQGKAGISEDEPGYDQEIVSKAMAYIGDTGGVLKFSKNTYYLTDHIGLTCKDVILDFSNSTFKAISNMLFYFNDASNFILRNVKINSVSGGGGVLFIAQDSSQDRVNVLIENVVFDGVVGAQLGFLPGMGLIPPNYDSTFLEKLYQYGFRNVIVRNCWFKNGDQSKISNGLLTTGSAYEIFIENCKFENNYDAGITINAPNAFIKSCEFSSCGAANGAVFLNGGKYGVATNVAIRDCTFNEGVPYDITITSAQRVTIENCKFNRPAYWAIRTKPDTISPEFIGYTIKDCIFNDVPWCGIYFNTGVKNVDIENNVFIKNGYTPITPTSKSNRAGIYIDAGGCDKIRILNNRFDTCYNCLSFNPAYTDGLIEIRYNSFINTVNLPIIAYPWTKPLQEIAVFTILNNDIWDPKQFSQTGLSVTLGVRDYGSPTVFLPPAGFISNFNLILHVTAAAGDTVYAKVTTVFKNAGETAGVVKEVDNSAGTAPLEQDFVLDALDKQKLWVGSDRLLLIKVYGESVNGISGSALTFDVFGSS